jgi:hypothetical protein
MLFALSLLLEWEYSVSVYTNTRYTRWRRFFFRIPCGTITKIRLNPPPKCTVTHNSLFDNGKITMKICLSISQWKNSKNKILTYFGPTIPLQNFPPMFRLFNCNSSQVSTLFPCTRNTQNRFLLYLATWSHIISQGQMQESAACSCSCSSSFLLISVKVCFV